MASSRNLLHPLKQSLAAITYSSSFPSHSRKFFHIKFRHYTSLGKCSGSVIRSRLSGTHCNLSTHRASFHKCCFSGSNKVRTGSGILAVCAVVGSISFYPRVSYAMDELDVLVHNDSESWSSSHGKDDPNFVWRFLKKLWLPLLFFSTIMSHLDDPLAMIAFKAILFLLSTNPSPFSVYASVTESLYAQKVEVRDYKLLCLAKVEVRDQKFTLVGILGGWWALPSSSSSFSTRDGPFSLLGYKHHQYMRNTVH